MICCFDAKIPPVVSLWSKVISALEAVLARNLISNDEWIFCESIVHEVRLRTFGGPQNTPDREIASVTVDGAFDTRKCRDAIAARGATAIIPPLGNA